MAGAKITIEFDDKAALAAIRNAVRVLADPTPLLDEIGEALVLSTRARAEAEVSPDGMLWAPLSPRYAKRKAKLRPGRGLLKFDFHMLGDMLAWQVDGDTLYVGTGAVYGARQHFGGGGIPPRPWLGVSDEDSVEIMALVRKYLGASLGDASAA